MIRNSLQESALQMKQYSVVQQGFGLIDIDKAYDNLMSKISDIKPHDYYQIRINSRQNENYNRTNDHKLVQVYEIELEDDGELSEDAKEKINNTPVTVILERVEVQEPNGKLTILTEDLPFSLIATGRTDMSNKVENIIFSNNLRNYFSSFRALEAMKEGNTYLAVYGIYQNGKRITNIIDAVHKPIRLLSRKTKINIQSNNYFSKDSLHSYAASNKTIAPNGVHRYFVKVTKNDFALDIKASILSDTYGKILINVFGPDGRKISGPWNIYDFPHKSTNRSSLSKSVDTRHNTGIYEITMSTSSNSWLASAQYNLLISSRRTGIMDTQLDLYAKSLRNKPNRQLIPIINHSTKNIPYPTLSGPVRINRVISLSPFPIQANRWSYKRFRLPTKEEVGKRTTQISVNINKNLYSPFEGRIVEHLYSRDDKDYFHIESTSPGLGLYKKTFNHVLLPSKNDPPKYLYVAVETYHHWDFSGKNIVTGEIDVQVHFPKYSLPQNMITSSFLHHMHTDTSILEVIYNKPFRPTSGETQQLVGKAYFNVRVDGAEYFLPFNLYE